MQWDRSLSDSDSKGKDSVSVYRVKTLSMNVDVHLGTIELVGESRILAIGQKSGNTFHHPR
jgi:hypothetical protein